MHFCLTQNGRRFWSSVSGGSHPNKIQCLCWQLHGLHRECRRGNCSSKRRCCAVEMWRIQHDPMALVFTILLSHIDQQIYHGPSISTPNPCLLNVHWVYCLKDCHTDSFIFKTGTKSHVKTKREVLQQISSIYDPLSFLAPIVMVSKILMQDI